VRLSGGLPGIIDIELDFCHTVHCGMNRDFPVESTAFGIVANPPTSAAA
jgi:hypothetical protein